MYIHLCSLVLVVTSTNNPYQSNIKLTIPIRVISILKSRNLKLKNHLNPNLNLNLNINNITMITMTVITMIKIPALQQFMTNPAGSAIVNTIGPIRQIVQENVPPRYLVIVPGTANQHGLPVQIQSSNGLMQP